MAESSLSQQVTAPIAKSISGKDAEMYKVLNNQGMARVEMAKDKQDKKARQRETMQTSSPPEDNAHNLIKELAGEIKSKDSLEIPVAERNLEVNADLASAWVQEEADPELRSVRQKIIDSINCVSFSDFKDNLSTTAQQLKARLKDSAYGIIYDYKPHSSKRWVFELASPDLSEYPPMQEGFFTPGWEARNGYPTLENMVSQGVTTIVVMDDAIYSGEQIINRTILPIYKYTQSPQFKTAIRIHD